MQYLYKQTHKLTRHLHADMELCMHVTQPHTHAVTNWQMGTQTQTNKQTNNGVGFLRGGGAGHSHKQLLFKVSGKIPPSSL